MDFCSYLLCYVIPDQVREQLKKVQVILKMYEDEQAEDVFGELVHGLQA